jgi:lactate dehydrogenase-like 2-hydroxyacid dehydrogenase
VHIDAGFLRVLNLAISSSSLGSATQETRDQMGTMAVKNLEAGVAGKALPTSVYEL